ncbi:hypothetical protein GBF38_017437 [Nibea albiflora]|uniref:Uncharacterized protein n=1 Tax=Nibea albiflora TaxID=240163 RepID=A0ACB7F548_NIBAL|nr:hypothetical protein GBF38_017437 [Nibea albiflora]
MRTLNMMFFSYLFERRASTREDEETEREREREENWRSELAAAKLWRPVMLLWVLRPSVHRGDFTDRIKQKLYSLPKQWGRICHVAQEDFPEGSRCSFIKLSNRVEQRKRIGKQWKEGREKKKKRKL